MWETKQGRFCSSRSKIENCVIADGVKVGDRVSLRDCMIGPGTLIENDGQSSPSDHSHQKKSVRWLRWVFIFFCVFLSGGQG